MGKYDDAIGGVNINLSINEVLDEKSHKKVTDKIDEAKKIAEEPIKIKIDSGEMDELLKQEKEMVKTIKQLSHLRVNAKNISGLLNGNMSKAEIQKTIDALNSLYDVQNRIRQVSGNTKRVGSDFLSGFSSNDIKTNLLPQLQEQLSALNKLGLDNIEQLRERERLSSRLSKITKKDLDNAKVRIIDGGDAEAEARAFEDVVANRHQVVEDMKNSKLFSEQEIKDIERQNKGLLEQIKLLREIRVAKVKDGEKIVVQKEDVNPIEEGKLPPARKPRAKKKKEPSEADIARQRDEEMQAFAMQLENLQKELGDSNKWLNQYNILMGQIQQGALTAAEAVAKLREEMAKPLTEDEIWESIDTLHSMQEQAGEGVYWADKGEMHPFGDFKSETDEIKEYVKQLHLTQAEAEELYRDVAAYNDAVRQISDARNGVGTLGGLSYEEVRDSDNPYDYLPNEINEASFISTAEKFISKLQEQNDQILERKRLMKETTLKETVNVEAKADEQSVTAEQTKLDLVEEELKVEKEITAENEKQADSKKSQSKPKNITNDTPNKFKADQGVQTSMDDMLPASAEDIAPKVESEVKGLDKVGEAAERAAESKNKLADANKKIADSVIEVDDEGGKNIWTTSRSGKSLDTLNLPVRYVGENGQDAVQMFAGLKSQIEEMTGKPVIIEFASNVNENGELEAIGATLKYVNEEAGVTVKQFYDIERGEGDMLIATQSYEKATLSKTKAAKAFNTEMQRKLAEEQVKTLESRMGTLKDSTGDFTQALQNARKAAANINGKEGLEDFNLTLRVANEKSKQLKSELKGQNTLDTIASMERRLLTLPNKIDEVQRKLNNLGNTEGADYVDDVIRSIQDEYQRFLTTDNAEEKASLFSSLISSMTWVDSELTTLSNRQKEIKVQETAVEKEELAKQKAARESYINWWKSTLEKQEKEEKPYRDYGKTTANSAVRKRDNLQGEIDALGVTNPEILAQIDAYKDKVQQVVDLREEFAKDPNAAKNPASVSKFQKISAEAERARKNIKAVIDEEQKMMQMSEEQGFSPVELSVDQIANLKNTMIDYAKSTKQGRVEIKGWNDDNTKMYYTVTNSKGAVEEMTMAIGQGTNKMYQYRTATKETGTLFQQVFKGIKVKAKELLSFVIGGGSIYKVISIFRQGLQYVRDIDLALTELKKVTDETEESYERFLETAAKTAEKVGSTIQKVVSSTADWARLGSVLAKTSISPLI